MGTLLFRPLLREGDVFSDGKKLFFGIVAIFPGSCHADITLFGEEENVLILSLFDRFRVYFEICLIAFRNT